MFLGSLVFLAIDLRATLRLLYIIFVVLSPMEKWNSEGVILLGDWVISGRFSESSESTCVRGMLCVVSLLYWISNSSSELPSLLHIFSCVRALWLKSFLSKHLLLSFLYDNFLIDGLVSIFDSSVCGFTAEISLEWGNFCCFVRNKANVLDYTCYSSA